jgi:hypothetical protein
MAEKKIVQGATVESLAGPEGLPDELAARFSQESYKAGMALTETLRTSEDPELIRWAAAEFMGLFERIELSTENFGSKYDLDRIASQIRERAFTLGLSRQELQERGIVKKVNTDNTAEVKESGYALGEREKEDKQKAYEEKDAQGRVIKETYRIVETRVPYLGTDEERKNVSEALEDAYAQIVMRGILHLAYIFHEKNSENLIGLAERYLHHHLTAEAVTRFFKYPAIWTKENSAKTAGGVEVKGLGHMTAMAMRLWDVVIGLSEKPAELQFYRRRPGWKLLFPGSTPEEPAKAEKEWVGDVENWHRGWKWDGSNSKWIVAEPGKAGLRRKDDLGGEAELRGPLAIFGNVTARDYDPVKVEGGIDEDGNEVLGTREWIRRFLYGGNENPPDEIKRAAKMAEENAFRLMRLWGTADRRGWEIYVDDKGLPELEMSMGPGIGSDYSKLMKVMFYYWKNQTRRRDAGPLATRSRYGELVVSLPQILAYKGKVGETKVLRTVDEWLWGYPAILDENGNIVEPEEPAYEMDQIRWGAYGRYLETAFYVKSFMLGREKVGVYDLIRKTDWSVKDLYELADFGFWENLMKRVAVGIGKETVAKGVYKGKTEEQVKEEQKALWEGVIRSLWDGIRSNSLYKSWEGEGVKIDVSGLPVEIPYRIIDAIRENVKLVIGIDLPKGPIKPEQTNWRDYFIHQYQDYLFPYPAFEKTK